MTSRLAWNGQGVIMLGSFAIANRRRNCIHDPAHPAVHNRHGRGVHGAFLVLALQRGQTLVGEARPRHRSLLLVHRAAVHALRPHRLHGAGDSLSSGNQHDPGLAGLSTITAMDRSRGYPFGYKSCCMSSAPNSRSTGSIAAFTPLGSGNITPCITRPKIWNGSRRPAFTRSTS